MDKDHCSDDSSFRPVCFAGLPPQQLSSQQPQPEPSPNQALRPSKRMAGQNSHESKRARKNSLATLVVAPPTFVRRFRSRSLPIIQYTSRAPVDPALRDFTRHKQSHLLSKPTSVPSLPPINMALLKEIDLHEILKNPQLRHDILFDPQLQFRPNLDGERGRRKRSIIDRYWQQIERECAQVFFPDRELEFDNCDKDSQKNCSNPSIPDNISNVNSTVDSTSFHSTTLTPPTTSASDPSSQANDQYTNSSLCKISSIDRDPSPSSVKPIHTTLLSITLTTSLNKLCRLTILFSTIRDILISLLPAKDRPMVTEIMDIDLLVQQLVHRTFDYCEMAMWLSNVFKSHCAPMRDPWVADMLNKFMDARLLRQPALLVLGLRMVFQILEAMKLDVANHQIRILRPVLVETAVEFERDYFQTLLTHRKLNISDSLTWFYERWQDCSEKQIDSLDTYADPQFRPVIARSVINLLLCRKMATEFPLTLAFDHSRLVLLRADVRQLVCIELCMALYRQLPGKSISCAPVKQVLDEIRAIVTDDNGNVKWTKNIQSIALQLAKHASAGDVSVVEFSRNWLSKHVQPQLEVYGLMESKVFRDIIGEISDMLVSLSDSVAVFGSSTTMRSLLGSVPPKLKDLEVPPTELKSVSARIGTLVKFHWSVFGPFYVDYIKQQANRELSDSLCAVLSVSPRLVNLRIESDRNQVSLSSRGNGDASSTKMPVLSL